MVDGFPWEGMTGGTMVRVRSAPELSRPRAFRARMVLEDICRPCRTTFLLKTTFRTRYVSVTIDLGKLICLLG